MPTSKPSLKALLAVLTVQDCQAATGALDHMVIDVIASLFDQILSDAKVPPQMARQIARLQLPVLRAALGDNSFFSSRRHPVRRFINRIASLGTAVEDFDSADIAGKVAVVNFWYAGCAPCRAATRPRSCSAPSRRAPSASQKLCRRAPTTM